MILCNRKMMTALLCATAVWSARAAAVLPAVRVEKVGEISRTEAKTYVGTVHGSEFLKVKANFPGGLQGENLRRDGARFRDRRYRRPH